MMKTLGDVVENRVGNSEMQLKASVQSIVVYVRLVWTAFLQTSYFLMTIMLPVGRVIQRVVACEGPRDFVGLTVPL